MPSTEEQGDELAVVVSTVRDIIAAPAVPVSGDLSRSVLLEAVDHLTSARLLGRSDVEALLDDLTTLSADLGALLAGHVRQLDRLDAAPPSPTRSGLLGDVARGDVLGAASVDRWSWPDRPAPLGHLDAELVTSVHPSLVDTWLVDVPGTDDGVRLGLALPTARPGVTWRADAGAWRLVASGATVHAADVLVLQAPATERGSQAALSAP